jgi:type IV pilus assembly protein PilB
VKLGRKDHPTEEFDIDVADPEVVAPTNGDNTHPDANGKPTGQKRAKAAKARRGRHVASEAADADASSQSIAPDFATEGQLSDLLAARGMADESQLSQARIHQAQSGQPLGDILVEMGAVGERELTGALGEVLGLEVVDLRRENPEQDAIELVPEELIRRYTIVPLRLDGVTLRLASAYGPTEDIRTLVSQVAERPVEFVLAPPSDLRWAIDSSYRAIGGVDRLVQAFEQVETSRRREADTAPAEVVDDTAPVVQVVARILTQAKRDRASDVHIEPSQDVVRVRFRIDGALKEVLMLPASMGIGLVSRIKIMAGMNIVERRRPQDGQLTTDIDGKSTDVRVSTAATIWGEKCVMRILDKNRSVLRLNELGMPDDTHETYLKLTRAPFGMVLCAGPTGSGKTTTLYATLTEVSDPSRNVMTIEDPVEFIFPSINQIQTNEQAGLTFATGLKSILRQDPDVILVGEIRDVETARIAVQSALTGHFVLSSLHATDSVSALHRFLDMGIESFLIASSVLAIVGQRLVRRICPSCKTAYVPTQEELGFYEESGGPAKQDFCHGVGCNFCGNTGYQDRIGVYELLQMTPEIKRLIVGWATQDELRRLAQKQGMRTLREEAIALVAQDVTTISEVIRSIHAL